MTNEEAINVLRGQEGAYWDTLTEAEHKAFDLAVDALIAKQPRVLTLDKNTLVLRCRLFMKPDSLAREKERVIEQLKDNSGVIMLPGIFDVMYVPEGTTVKIEECMR